MNEKEKAQLRELVRSPIWTTLNLLKDMAIGNINSQSVIRSTNDELLRVAISKEAKVEALREFFQEIIRAAQ